MNGYEQVVLDAAFDALIRRAKMLDEEHAVQGIDAYDELELHRLFEESFNSQDLNIHREVCYPSAGDAYTDLNHRARCDFVITPKNTPNLHDPALDQRARADAANTLFGDTESIHEIPADTCIPEDALWIEIKLASQFTYRDGIPVPNTQLWRELTNGLQTDVMKLSTDPLIWHAGVVMVSCFEDQENATRGFGELTKHCIEIGLPIRSPLISTGSITDRAGNSVVGVAYFPLSI